LVALLPVACLLPDPHPKKTMKRKGKKTESNRGLVYLTIYSWLSRQMEEMRRTMVSPKSHQTVGNDWELTDRCSFSKSWITVLGNDVSERSKNTAVCWNCSVLCVVSRIQMVKPDKARAVEDLLIRMAQSNQLRNKVTEPQLIDLLGQLNQQESGSTQNRVVVRQRRIMRCVCFTNSSLDCPS
jgi:hypothetical protein